MGMVMGTVFKASSGREVKPRENGSVMFDLGWGFLTREAAFDAEEYFQARRDEELGRWRAPQDPRFVVYESPAGVAFVFDEKAGDYQSFTRDQAFAIEGLAYRRAARAYFEAHPERKPWHDAEPGQVWMFGDEHNPNLVLAWRAREGWDVIGPSQEVISGVSDPIVWTASIGRGEIAAGRRIWREDAS